MTVAGPLALVTGGKRRLGAAIATRLAQAGYSLALVSHLDKQPEASLLAVLEEQQSDWHPFVADLGNPQNAGSLIDLVSSHFGRTPDLLVNNAAIFGQDDSHSMNAESLETHFGLNLFAPLLLSQALVKAAASQVAIVHVTDQRTENPPIDQISYTLSKQALAASVRTMAKAFGAKARVNAVAPGLVIVTDDYAPGQNERLAHMMPLMALPDPVGVADAVLFLAHARHVTGQILFVDGGAHLESFERDFVYL